MNLVPAQTVGDIETARVLFLVSAKPLSLEWRGRDLVNSTRSLSSILAT